MLIDRKIVDLDLDSPSEHCHTLRMQQSIINIRVILRRLKLFHPAGLQTNRYTLVLLWLSTEIHVFLWKKSSNLDTEYLQVYIDIMIIKNQPFLLQINAYFQENLQKFDNSSTSTTIKNGNLELIKKWRHYVAFVKFPTPINWSLFSPIHYTAIWELNKQEREQRLRKTYWIIIVWIPWPI